MSQRLQPIIDVTETSLDAVNLLRDHLRQRGVPLDAAQWEALSASRDTLVDLRGELMLRQAADDAGLGWAAAGGRDGAVQAFPGPGPMPSDTGIVETLIALQDALYRRAR